jgi:hypothetical protein
MADNSGSDATTAIRSGAIDELPILIIGSGTPSPRPLCASLHDDSQAVQG